MLFYALCEIMNFLRENSCLKLNYESPETIHLRSKDGFDLKNQYKQTILSSLLSSLTQFIQSILLYYVGGL